MPGLSPVEATDASNAFLWTLYGDELYEKWISVKQQMNFENERDYVSWLMVLVDEHFMPQRNENDIPGKEVFQPSESLQSSSLVKSEVVHQEETSTWPKQQHQKQSVSGGDEIILSSDSESFSGYVDDVGVTYDSTDISTDVNSGVGEVNVAYTNSERKRPHTFDHEGRKQFICQYCVYSTRFKHNLDKHVLAVHKKLKKYACPYCLYRCAAPSNLKCHLISKHNHTSRYSCTDCGKYFYTPKKLLFHQKNVCFFEKNRSHTESPLDNS